MPEDGGWQLLESQVKIALDTNMLLAVEKFKLGLLEEIESNFPKALIAVPEQVLQELEILQKRSKSLEKQVKIAKEVLKKAKFKVLQSKESNADKALLELSRNGFIIATNDKELRKKVKKNSGKCLILRKKKFLVLE